MPERADFPPLCFTRLRAEWLFLTDKPRMLLFLRPSSWEIRPSARRIVRCIGAPLILGGLLMGPCMMIALPTAAVAQAAQQRVVQGKVELSSGGMAKGAIVYIKNAKTLEMRTYISTDDGSYRFGQLNQDADYTVWAEYQGKKSKERTISSFDTKKVFTVVLRIGA